jgi:exonuclease III
MKIATFNINDVNKRLGNLIGWLLAEKPDVVALQELKAADREFPKAAIERRATAPCGAAKRPGTASPSWRAAASRS